MEGMPRILFRIIEVACTYAVLSAYPSRICRFVQPVSAWDELDGLKLWKSQIRTREE
jgi:hypothetical protein